MAVESHLDEVRIGREELVKGRFLHAFRDTVRLPDGGESYREFVVHPGAVMVIPVLDTPEGPRVVLERQFRYPVGQVMIEFPAGKLDPDEAPWRCAQRELREETGYTARQWARAGQIHPVIAYSTEAIDIWFARDLTLGARKLDVGEFLDVFTARRVIALVPARLGDRCQDGQWRVVAAKCAQQCVAVAMAESERR